MAMFDRLKLINIATGEVGYLEKNSSKNLDNKTANAGNKNYTKYARDLYGAGYYNGNKQSVAWCDVFVDWCFYKAFGKANGQALQCQTGDLGASCTYSAQYYKNKKQFYTKNPQVGDQIFFGDSSGCTHTGLVYKVDGSKVYTIEGNTSSASGVVANGGGVFKKSYALTYSKIVGYGRPKYNDGYGTTVKKKSVETIAKEVLNGVWGNGSARKSALIKAGYDYNAVQKKVNELLSKKTTKSVTEIAKEVINGKWGNGATRKSKLTAAGYNYDEVQKEVNRLLR